MEARQQSRAQAAASARRRAKRAQAREESEMYVPINLQEVTDRVRGLSPPRVPMAARLPKPWDRLLGLVLMTLSASVSVLCLGLWIDGYTTMSTRLFVGAVIGLALAVRLL